MKTCFQHNTTYIPVLFRFEQFHTAVLNYHNPSQKLKPGCSLAGFPCVDENLIK